MIDCFLEVILDIILHYNEKLIKKEKYMLNFAKHAEIVC